jgi:hypothetical protein
MPDPAYQRLTRERVSNQFVAVAAPRISLWLGSDHLLLVERMGYSETCKRFHFRDIQAIIIQESFLRTIWNAILLTLLGICLIGLVASVLLGAVTAAIVWLFLTVLVAVPATVNNVYGPGCTCRLQTAVQTETLGSISRVRQARKLLEKLRPLIAAAQGQLLTPEEASARMLESVRGQPPVIS